MSWNPALDPGCPDEIGVDAIETLIIPRARDQTYNSRNGQLLCPAVLVHHKSRCSLEKTLAQFR